MYLALASFPCANASGVIPITRQVFCDLLEISSKKIDAALKNLQQNGKVFSFLGCGYVFFPDFFTANALNPKVVMGAVHFVMSLYQFEIKRLFFETHGKAIGKPILKHMGYDIEKDIGLALPDSGISVVSSQNLKEKKEKKIGDEESLSESLCQSTSEKAAKIAALRHVISKTSGRLDADELFGGPDDGE